MSDTQFDVTPNAAKRIAFLASKEAKPVMMRVAVLGGGCSGFQYNFSFEDARQDDDLVIERDGAAVLVDFDLPRAAQGQRARLCRGDGRLVVPGEEPERHLLLRLRQLLQRLRPVRPHMQSAWARTVACSPRIRLGGSWVGSSNVPVSCIAL